MQKNTKEIGGYFEFGLSNLGQFPYPDAIKYCSARSAFYDLVSQKKIKKIWMPKFICNSMLAPLEILAVEILFYDLDENFFPITPSFLKDDEYLLYVNYFGICTAIQHKILTKYPPKKIIFDHSQAFFIKPLNVLATIYSPRKYLPVAEGGLLISNDNIVAQYHERNPHEMVEQYQYGLIRCVAKAGEGYAKFRKNENIFEDCIPRQVSNITEEILGSLNYDEIKAIRLRNFEFLHKQLKHYNFLNFDINQLESPLTYPLLLEVYSSNYLIDNKIYTPTYWSDALERVEENSFEFNLISKTVHLICDHRYTLDDMQYQVNTLKEFLNEH